MFSFASTWWYANSPVRVVKLVSSLPLAGVGLRQMQSMVNAFQMAVDEAGQRAGPFHIEYASWNDANPNGTWDADLERTNAERAAADPDVVAYLGPYNSGAAKVSIPILNRAGLLEISPDNTYPGLTKAGPHAEPGEPGMYYPTGVRNYCRLVPTDQTQGEAEAQWALTLRKHKVYVLSDQDVFGTHVADIFRDACVARGLSTIGPVRLDVDHADINQLMQRIEQAQPDLVFFGGTTETGAGVVARALFDARIDTAFMGTGGIMETAFIESAGLGSQNAYCTLGVLPVQKLPQTAKEWYDRYLARYREPPEAYAMYAYEAARVALRGIAQAGRKDRAAIRDAVMATRNYDGVLGTWSFDTDGDTSIDTVSGYQVRNFRFEFVGVIRPH